MGFVLGSTVGNAMNMATQDTSDVTRIRCCGRGTRGRFLGLFGSISHECGGVTRGVLASETAAEGGASPGSEGGGRRDTSVEVL